MFHPVGIFGPSYVGKTSFGRFLAENGSFKRLPIWTSRPPRVGEYDPDMYFTSEREIIDLSRREDWIVNKVGENHYAMSLTQCHAMLAESHVLVGLTREIKDGCKGRLPSLFTLLLWPLDFADLQHKLAHAEERPIFDREARLAANDYDAGQVMKADLTLIVERQADAAARIKHFADLQEILLSALKCYRPPVCERGSS